MPQYQEYRPYESEIDPMYQNVLKSYLSGELSPAQQQMIQRERERGLSTMREQYGGRGAPTGAQRGAEERYLGDIALRGALLGGQQQQMGLQYGMPYMQYGAQQYWMPEQMSMQRYGLDLQGEQQDINRRLAEAQIEQMQSRPWYEQALQSAGGLLGDIATPWAWSRYIGGSGNAQATNTGATSNRYQLLPPNYL